MGTTLRVIRHLTLVAVVSLVLATGVSGAFALENSGCLGCHETPPVGPAPSAPGPLSGPMSGESAPLTPKIMTVPDVDRDTACKACHMEGFVGSHPFHQVGSNCGAACHPSWGDSLQTAVPSYVDPVSGASFASSASKDTPAALLHIIHSKRRWPADVNTPESACSSCHEVAACDACHTGVVDATHSGHGQTGSGAFPARGTYSGVVGRGVVGNDQSLRSATLEANSCAISECHDLDGTAQDYPGAVEDYNYAVGENPDDVAHASMAVTKIGLWRTRSNNLYSGSRMSYAGVAGAELTVTFNGTRIELVSDKDPYRGYAEVVLDGSIVATVNAYAPVTQRQAVLYTSETLWDGDHTLTIRPLGTRSAEARATFFVVDAVRVFREVPRSVSPACARCHSGLMHPANHAGTDAAIRASNGGKGCSDTPAQYQTGCHDISDLAKLHAPMKAEGCDPCHAPGRTPARECKTCHDDSGVAGYASSTTLYPSSDDTLTAAVALFPAAPATRYSKVCETSTAGDADTSYVEFSSAGRSVFGVTAPASLPASSTITNVTVYYRMRYVTGAGTPCNAGASLKVGGQYFNQPGVNNATAAYVLRSYAFSNNPKTGLPWTVAQVTDPGNADALQGLGVYTTDATPPVRITQAYAVVNYNIGRYVQTVTTGVTHHNNVKYLLDRRDAEIGAYYYDGVDPAHGWSAKSWQDCNAACHESYVGPSWSAYDGTYMWYSLAGQYQSLPETRTLTLDAGVLPASSSLSFKTRWQFYGALDGSGCVEASTDNGRTWTTLTGTVFGISRSQLTMNSPASWGDAVYDLSAYAGRDTQLRFRYNMSPYTSGPGWSVDAISITGATGTVYSDSAETLSPQMSASQWYREKAAYGAY